MVTGSSCEWLQCAHCLFIHVEQQREVRKLLLGLTKINKQGRVAAYKPLVSYTLFCSGID